MFHMFCTNLGLMNALDQYAGNGLFSNKLVFLRALAKISKRAIADYVPDRVNMPK